MALDRQSIERKDFPVGRRGYDPGAVDAHLSAVADEIADLRRCAPGRSDTLASSASEQVRAILDAAETSAAEIQRAAENQAREIRNQANNQAQEIRDQAVEDAREYLGRVSESTNDMLQRLDAMETELGDLIDSLRAGSNRVTADLRLLEANLADVTHGVRLRPAFESESGVDGEPEPHATPEPEAAGNGHGAPVAVDGEGEVVGSEASESARGRVADDAEGARLIALNMALNGTPREETDRYLSENFELSDRHGLLDEVYASVDG